ncbi:MAG: Rpn family recombination-promoting nuclease/putative transposase [Gemmatimonadetes bacterium]|nr:Rpn family recombination-promoting nuclease/putative transposase [Gemmatimonadota bacterium]
MPNDANRQTKPRHDAAYKSFFSRQSAVEDTLRLAARELARHLDFATLKRMPASFVTERLGQRHADMLWKALTVEGSWLYLFILLEFQSTVDRRMALRMMDYTVRILRGLDKDDLGPAGVHPPILPVVIYNGERRWTAATDVRDLFAPVPDELLGYLPRHRYLLIEVQALRASEKPSDNLLSLIASFEQAHSLELFEEALVEAADWLENATDRELAKLIKAWVALVLVQRFGTEGIGLEERLWEEEGTKMTTLIERARKWGEERDQQWLEKGLEKGIRRGRLQGERDLVLRMAARRFGAGAADDLAPVLAAVSDSDRVAAIAARVFECETADELIEWARGILPEDQAD